MSDSYKPSYQNGGPPGSNVYAMPTGPPPPGQQFSQYSHPLPPLPPGPPPPMHYFGHAPYSSSAATEPYRYNNFAFTTLNDLPRYPDHAPAGGPRYGNAQNPRRRDMNRNGQGTNNRQHRGGGRGARVAPSDRPLLTFQRGNTPEQLFGMNDDNAEQRFLDIDDMSDSAEESMQESDPEDYEPELLGSDVGADADDGESLPARKKKRLSPAEGAMSVPKWSNPETYTALPPPDETARKKKDMVKLIRKARVIVEKDNKEPSQAATNDDFISFDFNDEAENDETALASGEGMPGAPTGPRTSNNLQTIQRGQEVMSIDRPRTPMSADHDLLPEKGGSKQIIEKLSEDRKRKRGIESPKPHGLYEPPRKKGAQPFSGGHVLDEWLPQEPEKPDTTAVPWIATSYQATENAGFRLHKEICDFYDFVRPRAFEDAMRSDLLDRLQAFIFTWNRACKVHCFGSYAAGLYLPNADMDVVVISEQFERTGRPTICQVKKHMFILGNLLETARLARFGSVEVIHSAKVPLVKFVDGVTDIRVDMSFENMTGIVANGTFQQWKKQYPAMPILVTIIKQFLMMRGLNEVVNGGIGGFTVTCLVTSLLQNMPRIQMKEFKPENNLGEILLEFLDYYGNQFDYSRVVIRMAPPALIPKHELEMSGQIKMNRYESRLAIIDPNKQSNDISGGSKRIQLIFDKFSQAREQLLQAMRLQSRKSLLDWMLGGNYNTFHWHRERLRSLYVSRFGNEDVDAEVVLEQKTHVMKCASPKVSACRTIASPAMDDPDSIRARSLKSMFPDRKIPNKLSKKEFQSMSMRFACEGHPAAKEVHRAKQLSKEFPDRQIPDKLSHSLYRTLRRQFMTERGPIRKEEPRASSLKGLHPDSEIPDELSKKKFNRLNRQFESEEDPAAKDAQRAEQLRKEFPNCQIPNELSKSIYRMLRRQFLTGRGGPITIEEDRASTLKKLYPDREIPDELSRKEYLATRTQFEASTQPPKRKRKTRHWKSELLNY